MKRVLLFLALAFTVAAQTARFPSNVATDADLMTMANRAQSQLSGSMTSSATSFTVVSGSQFSANMLLSIENEIVKVCSIVGQTVNVGYSSCPSIDGRGYDGTAAASHASGKTVAANVDAWHHNALAAEIKAIETALGAGLTSAIPNPLPVNKGGTNAQTAAGARTQLGAAAAGANSDITSLNALSTPIPVSEGGTGAATLTGIPVASGSSPLTAVSGTEGQYLRRKLNNGVTAVYEFTAPSEVYSADYDFPPQTPGGSLVALGVNQVINALPCPLGVNGTNTNYRIWIQDGTGTPEAALVTGGTCLSGAASGTITVTPTFAHSGAWTWRSSSDGISEAIWVLPTSGGIVRTPRGVITIEGTITIGNGVGTTQSTRKSVILRGQGYTSPNTSFSSGTMLSYAGASGGTAIKIQGPIQGVELSDFTIDGNSLISKGIDIMACAHCNVERVGIRELATGGAIGLLMDAQPDFNGNTAWGNYNSLVINADASGATCLSIGPTDLDFNSGNFRNTFTTGYCSYKNDSPSLESKVTTSGTGVEWVSGDRFVAALASKSLIINGVTYTVSSVTDSDSLVLTGSAGTQTNVRASRLGSNAVRLGWADNNVFINFMMQAVDAPGSGSAIHHIRQSVGSDPASPNDFLPSENIFLHPSIACPTCTSITGDSGRTVGTFIWPYQVNDSAGLPNVKGVRGVLTNGEFFETSPVSRWAFQNRLAVNHRSAAAEFNVTGFLAGAAGAGTISSSGTTVTGVGTAFDSTYIGRYIYATSEQRRVTAVAGATSLTIANAFTDNVPALTSWSYSLGSSGFWISDGSTNIGTYDNSPLKLWAGNTNWGYLAPTGEFTNRGPIIGTSVETIYGNAGVNTIPASSLLNGHVVRTGGGARTDTTATAAQIVAAVPNAQTGMEFHFTIYNNAGGTNTLGLGSGVSLAAGFTSVLTTTAGNAHRFVLRLTNVTPSSEAVAIYSQGQIAY